MNLKKKTLPLNPRLVINLMLCAYCVYTTMTMTTCYFIYYFFITAHSLRLSYIFPCSLYNELLCDYGRLRYFAERESAGKALCDYFLMRRAKGCQKKYLYVLYIPTGSYVIIAILIFSIIIRTRIYVSVYIFYEVQFTNFTGKYSIILFQTILNTNITF